MYIGGAWTESLGGQTFERRNPATGEPIAVLAKGSVEDAKAAIEAANHARLEVRRIPVHERASLCRAIAEELDRDVDSLARRLTEDQGKPLHEARAEVRAAAEFFRDAAEQVIRLETAVLPSPDPNKRILTIRQPHGVVAIITPWNYPVGIPSYYLASAFASGNAIVWKPAPTGSVVAGTFLERLLEAGLPAFAINLLYGEAEVGSEMVGNPGTHAVGFTGSSKVGNLVAQQAGAKPVLLELGGNGPVILLEDADVEQAVRATAYGSFSNAGQICQSSERILVHPQIHKEVVDGLAAQAADIRLGDPLDEATTMGPLNNEGVAQKMDQHIADALQRGAMVVTGGRRASGFPTSLFYEPTVLDWVPADSLINQEETFGPIAPVTPVEDLEETISIANQCTLGLVCSVYTRDLGRAFYLAERLECGVVNVNETTAYWDGRTPFGGYSGKGSGVGRLGGKATILAMTQNKSLVMDVGYPAI